jgi:hypothetical protein
MAATFDLKDVIGKNRPQTNRRVEIPFRLDFGDISGGMDAGESVAILKTPKGFVKEEFHPFLVTAEGAAGNLDFGTEADSDGLLDGGDCNGTPGAAIALAGTETIKAGTLMSETEIQAKIAAAQPTLDTAVIYGVLIGYIIDLPTA